MLLIEHFSFGFAAFTAIQMLAFSYSFTNFSLELFYLLKPLALV